MDESLTVADASASSSSGSNASLPPSSLSTNLPLISAALAFAIAQFLKIFTTWFKEKRWDSKRLLSSGGMPSSHSATVTSLAIAIGLQEGTGGSMFALAVVLATVVMYDASGVRLQAGRQAELLNQIVCELPQEHPLSHSRPLREPLGHTPIQRKRWTCSSSYSVHVVKEPTLGFASQGCGRCDLGIYSSLLAETFSSCLKSIKTGFSSEYNQRHNSSAMDVFKPGLPIIKRGANVGKQRDNDQI